MGYHGIIMNIMMGEESNMIVDTKMLFIMIKYNDCHNDGTRTYASWYSIMIKYNGHCMSEKR